MNHVLRRLVVFALVWVLKPTGANLPPALDMGGSRTRRGISCRDNLEYLIGNICCLNCPAGTRVTSACTRAGEKGECEECDYGTFTEHDNGLKHCFKCTQCRSDQEVVRQCTHTQDTECRCKSGRFCVPDQACEVCKKCSRCGSDEEVVRNCTSTTNTECKKIQPKSRSDTRITPVIVVSVVSVLIITGIAVFAVFVCKKRTTQRDTRRDLPDRMKAGQYTAISLPGESGGGETGITNLILPRQPEDEQFPKLVPMNGEESLRKCFGYLEELDMDQHKRFFRQLGISDNVIKSKESLPYEDRIHELLNIWVEKEGREASLNDLLKALLELNQRRTAEMVKENAIKDGHYCCEC